MNCLISVDVGGTFTDCVVYRQGQVIRAKSPTTSYDLAVGFLQTLGEAAGQLGITRRDLLAEADQIRYSTTAAINSLIQRTGPRLGLITTAGHEHVLVVGRSRQWADGKSPLVARNMAHAHKPAPLIPLDRTVGLRERVDCFGEVVEPLDEADVRQKVQYLADRGVRGFVVCLLWSFLNPAHEQRVREIINEMFPQAYLGHMPVMLSSEVHPKWHEYPRTNVTILNAYLLGDMNRQLRSLERNLRAQGYARPLHIMNNSGGIAKVTRTRPVETYSAGPIAGLFGAAFLGARYGLRNIVVGDMGGTSFDYGLIREGEIESTSVRSAIDCWLTETAHIDVKSIGAGGGSIAWINAATGGTLEVGPMSAGSNPGPACYNLGGRKPTVTDADLVLGYLNPQNFLGGRLTVSLERAAQAIQRQIAGPLGIGLDEAAAAMRAVVDARMGGQIAKDMYLKGLDPAEFDLFAYGGAGPTHACHFAEHLGAKRVLAPLFASVFCALGGITIDLRHTYERSRHLSLLRADGSLLSDWAAFNQVVADMMDRARQDLISEGAQAAGIQYELHLGMHFVGQLNLTRIRSPYLRLDTTADARGLLESFARQYDEQFGAVTARPGAGVEVQEFYLTAVSPMPRPDLPRAERGGPDATAACTGHRQVFWPEYEGRRETPIYDAARLAAGNRITGPAVIESVDTTCVLPPGWVFVADEYQNGLMTRLS